ncbi:YkgJ family cysteine cluster protein [Halostella sp. JP-L12]|uniref:YkgJ family cysteine cluster protein n=1 Tax=Halostella TaxID=1843185 RepID=UPI000EF84F25|nr:MULTISPECIES: YkgJ family cysteine cluster protein [Halostella]NHN46102.1 YkgJ family cysteine cluster protein [Halostella sp. JP-L12]
MEVNCEGCAGCCLDWRALADADLDHERRGPYEPVDGEYNLVALTRDEVRAFLDAGLGDALRPRLWYDGERGGADGAEADDPDDASDAGVRIDGAPVAAVRGRPVFFVGLRRAPKPVAPFGRESETWLPTCVFLDPATLQCRLHDSERYPSECAEFPGHNLKLDVETECERVEREFGGDRLLDDEPPGGMTGPLFGPQALGQKVFVHPDPDRLDGAVDRMREGDLTAEDRAEFAAVAAASTPGTTSVNDDAYERAYEAALGADSWVGRAVDDWRARAGDPGERAPDAPLGDRIEGERGAPDTPGW